MNASVFALACLLVGQTAAPIKVQEMDEFIQIDTASYYGRHPSD